MIPKPRLPFDKGFLIIFLSVLALSLSVAYAINSPKSGEQFVGLTTLGSDLKTYNYYPHDHTTVTGGEVVLWNTKVYNNMGTPQYVSVRVKLLNATQEGPDPISKTPSSSPTIVEFNRLINDKETWTIPLEWYIATFALDPKNEQIDLLTAFINDKAYSVNSSNNFDEEFRWVIELWVYDRESKALSFDWSSGNQERIAWNQIVFSFSLPQQT